MAPKNKTALCLDISCYRLRSNKDNPWKKTNQELIQKCVEDCIKANLINKEDFREGLVVRVKDAYPFYDINYKKN